MSLYTIASVFFYYDWLFDMAPGLDAVRYEVVLNVAVCAGAGVVLAAFKRGWRVPVVAGPACAAYVFALLVLATVGGQAGQGAVDTAGALGGFATGALMPLWFERLGSVSDGRYGRALGAMSFASCFTVLAVNLLPRPAMATACLAFLGLSAWCYQRTAGTLVDAPEKGARTSVPTAKPGSPLLVPLAYVFMLSVVCGTLDKVVTIGEPFSTLDAGYALQVGSIVTNALFLAYAWKGRGRYRTAFDVLLGAVATALLLLPFLPTAYRFALLVFAHMGWESMLLVAYALVIGTFRGEPQKLVPWAAVAFALPRPGLAVGSEFASLIAADGGFAFTQMTMLAFALAYLVMMGVWLLSTRERRESDRALLERDELIDRFAQAREDMFDLACEEIAREHLLTHRESELLLLLAQGRNVSYIGDEMGVSRNTVKSYTRSVYAKLDIHSKQELIDLVKDYMCSH